MHETLHVGNAPLIAGFQPNGCEDHLPCRSDPIAGIVDKMVSKLEGALCPVCGFARSIADMVGYDVTFIEEYKRVMVARLQGAAADAAGSAVNAVTDAAGNAMEESGSFGGAQEGYDSLSNAFAAFSDDKLTAGAGAVEDAGNQAIDMAAAAADGELFATASSKTFSFEASMNGLSMAITFYLFIPANLVSTVVQGLRDAHGTGNAYDWSTLEIDFAVKFHVEARDFQVTSLPFASGMSDSWLKSLKVNGALELVLSSCDIDDAAGATVIKKGFSFAGIVSNSGEGNAPFMETPEQASEGENSPGHSTKYLQGYLPIDIGLGRVSYDPSLGTAWAQVGLTGLQFKPSFNEGAVVDIASAYLRVEGLGDGFPTVTFFADVDINLGDEEVGCDTDGVTGCRTAPNGLAGKVSLPPAGRSPSLHRH